MNKCKLAKLEVERQLKIADKYAVEPKDWKRINKEWKNLLGAYHQGRKEALEDILNKLDSC